MNNEIIKYLTKLKNIYSVIDEKHLTKEIKNIQIIIQALETYTSENSSPLTKKLKKPSFQESYECMISRNYEKLVGTKLNYKEFSNPDDVVFFIENNEMKKVIRTTNVLDLKLLYCLLTQQFQEIKGTKQAVYDSLKRIVRARRRGEAFLHAEQIINK